MFTYMCVCTIYCVLYVLKISKNKFFSCIMRELNFLRKKYNCENTFCFRENLQFLLYTAIKFKFIYTKRDIEQEIWPSQIIQVSWMISACVITMLHRLWNKDRVPYAKNYIHRLTEIYSFLARIDCMSMILANGNNYFSVANAKVHTAI